MIRSKGTGFITVGDKELPVSDFSFERLTPSKIENDFFRSGEDLRKLLCGGWTITGTINYNASASVTESALDVIDSTAHVIGDQEDAAHCIAEALKMPASELGWVVSPSNTVDSTATVIDDEVKA